MDKNYIPIIFGLKVKQFRNELGYTTDELAKSANLSKSYLNEIEKGKKYPKAEKIIALSNALNVPYDELVSLELHKKLKPVGDLLQSNVLSEIPLNLFGIDERSLIDIIVNAPDKINAFISTLLEMASNYNFTKESFYLAALRSYQEVNDNYFPSIEEQSRTFSKTFGLEDIPTKEDLEHILTQTYGYTIDYLPFEERDKNLVYLRSYFIPAHKTLLINSTTLPEQILFILAKEIGINYMALNERVNTFTWAKFDTFEQVLNNFYASYFAGAVLIPEKSLVPQLKKFFDLKKWRAEVMDQLIERFGQSAETFYHRLTNLLPEHLGLKSLFFIRLVHEKQTESYRLDKELHLDEKQSPHAIEMDEHYCRRWVSVKVLQYLENHEGVTFTDSQYSIYPQYNNKRYFVISTATQDPFRENNLRSVTLGFSADTMGKKIKFANGKEIPEYQVDITCENCPIMDCEVRMCPPVRLNEQLQQQQIVDALEILENEYAQSET